MDDAPQTQPIDASAVLWSAPVSSVLGRPLLVLLHGLGSHEGDLFGLSPYLPLEPVIASLRAPSRYGGGHAWFPPGENAAEQADAATRGVLAWLDSLPATGSVGLLGFSQGGAMALQLMRHAPERFAYAVQLSGFVIGEHPGDAALARRRPPVFWGRGTEDDVISQERVERTGEWLPAHSSLDARIYEGLAHGINGPEIADIAAFLRGELAPARG